MPVTSFKEIVSI